MSRAKSPWPGRLSVTPPFIPEREKVPRRSVDLVFESTRCEVQLLGRDSDRLSVFEQGDPRLLLGGDSEDSFREHYDQFVAAIEVGIERDALLHFQIPPHPFNHRA
jgi:hypothetical protein